MHDRFGPENVISVSEIVQHDTHCGRGYEMTMLTMTIKQAHYLYISIQNGEETILVRVTLPALCHHRRPEFGRVAFNRVELLALSKELPVIFRVKMSSYILLNQNAFAVVEYLSLFKLLLVWTDIVYPRSCQNVALIHI